MNCAKRECYALLLAPFFLVALAGAAAPPAKNTCEKEWKQLQTNPLFASTTAKIKQFESYAFLCAGSGLYEVQLAQLYMQAEPKELGKAKQLLVNALKQSMPHRKELLEQAATVHLLNADLPHAQDIFKILIRDFPDSHEGYAGQATVLLMQHQSKESIELYEKANSLQPTLGAYRNLVIAYTLEHRYQDATNAFDRYYRADHAAFGDRDAAIAAAVSFAKQDRWELADGTLRALLLAKPGVKDDKEFVELFRNVNAQLLAKQK